MPTIFRYPHTVRPEEIDPQGHANNLEYLRWTVRAAVAHSAAQGWTPQRYQSIAASWVVRSHQIEYFQPCFAGEQIHVLTWIANFRKVRSLRKYKIVRDHDNTELATGQTDWVFVETPGLTPRRIPEILSGAFEKLDSADEP